MLTPEQVKERDLLVWGEERDWSESCGGILYFEGMSPDTARQLIEKGYLDPEDCQNSSPEAETLVAWGEAHHGMGVYTTFDGYVVEPTRHDCRISIETVYCEWYMVNSERSEQILIDFVNEFRMADEFQISTRSGMAWWD